MPYASNDAGLWDDVKRLLAERSFNVNELCDLATPVLLIDDVVLSRNIQRMAAYCRTHGIALRPHTKTHKSLDIARRQLADGAVGLTVAKPGESRVMAATGAPLLIAYPPITSASLQTVEQLRRQVELTVALDSLEAVERLVTIVATSDGPPIGVLIDVDLGLKRTGVATPEESRQIAERIAATENLRLDGIFCYPGHVDEPPNQQNEAIHRANETILQHLDFWAAAGLQASVVSGGSTPTAFNSHLMTGITEIRPGTYVFNDTNTLRGGHCTLADCAARVVTTIISNAVADQVVVDAGSKSLARDQCIPQPAAGYGFVLEYPEARVTALSEEHGKIDISRCARSPCLGERISIIPNHICPAVNLTDAMVLRTEAGDLQELPVDARGMVR